MCVFSVFALRWLPAGSLSAETHLHRGSGGGCIGENRQTCTHKQTDEYARAKQLDVHKHTNTNRQMNMYEPNTVGKTHKTDNTHICKK